MIVVTGPGRSGTSLVASLYKELGFDPGGRYDPEARGGYEDPEVVQANIDLLHDLGMGSSARRFGLLRHLGVPTPIRWAGRRFLPTGVRYRLRSVVKEPPWGARRIELLRWDRLAPVAARHAERLQKLASSRRVVKDPRFCWTLHAWAAAGVPIEHVLVCVRPLEAVLDSRQRSGWLAPRSQEAGRNWFAYGLGLCLSACHDHRLPHAVVRFPDFTGRPRSLYEAMAFPDPVDYERFAATFAGAVRPDLIHDRR